MDTQPAPRATRLLPIVIVGLVAVAGMLGYLAYARGAFARRERIAIVTWNQDPFWGPTQQGATDAAREMNVNLTFVESLPDPAVQTQHVRDLLAAGVDALAISPNNPTSQKDVIDEAADKVVVVTFDSDAPTSKRRGFVGTNDYAAGQIAGEEVRAACPDGGAVLVSVGSVDMSNGRDRRQGLVDDLLDRPFNRSHTYDPVAGDLKGQTYSVPATVIDGGDRQAAIDGVAAALKAHPDVKCVVGLFSYSGMAVVAAVDKAGLKGKVKIIGFDESADEQAAVLSGDIYSSVLQDQYRCGYETVRVLADQLRHVEQNGPVRPRLVELPVMVMRASNIPALRETRVIRQVDGK